MASYIQPAVTLIMNLEQHFCQVHKRQEAKLSRREIANSNYFYGNISPVNFANINGRALKKVKAQFLHYSNNVAKKIK